MRHQETQLSVKKINTPNFMSKFTHVQVPRQFPYDNLYLERGGDPDRLPTDEERAETVKATYGSEYSS